MPSYGVNHEIFNSVDFERSAFTIFLLLFQASKLSKQTRFKELVMDGLFLRVAFVITQDNIVQHSCD